MKIATFFLCFHGLLQCDQSIMLYPSTGPKIFLTVHILRARPKIELHLVLLNKKIVPAQTLNVLNGNNLLVWHKKFGIGTICKSIFGLAQNIWTSSRYFGTCRRDVSEARLYK